MGVSGFAAADNLTHLGARVTALDESEAGDRGEKATLLEILGATVRLGPGSTAELPDDVDLVVTSPGWSPSAPLLAQAAARGIPVWGEVELGWRLRDPEHPAPWLAVTGTNGKTTTVQMLEAMLRAGGLRTVACGNVGLPIVEAVMDPDAVRRPGGRALQLPAALHLLDGGGVGRGAQRRGGPPRLVRRSGRWHGRLHRGQGPDLLRRRAGLRLQRGRPGDRAARPRRRGAGGCPGHRVHPRHAGRRHARAGRRRARRPGVHRGAADHGRRAVHALRPRRRTPRTTSPTPSPLRRWRGRTASPPGRSSRPCASSGPDGHRIAEVAVVDGVTWIDDSKATNPHAALASLQGYDPVVWVAGGLAKGARFDDLVAAARERLRGVVLLGPGRSRHQGVAFATRARCARDRSGARRDCRGRTHGPRGCGCCAVGTARRHRAPCPGMRIHGHVRRLRRTRRRLRGGRAPEATDTNEDS